MRQHHTANRVTNGSPSGDAPLGGAMDGIDHNGGDCCACVRVASDEAVQYFGRKLFRLGVEQFERARPAFAHERR